MRLESNTEMAKVMVEVEKEVKTYSITGLTEQELNVIRAAVGMSAWVDIKNSRHVSDMKQRDVQDSLPAIYNAIT